MPPKPSNAKSKSKRRPKPSPTTTHADTSRNGQGQGRDDGGQEQPAPTIQRTLPCATVIKDEPNVAFHPYGNSIAEDLFLHLDVFASPGRLTGIDALLAGTGDLRHVLHTLAELKRKLATPDVATPATVVRKHLQQREIASGLSRPLPLRINLYMNDQQAEVIARDILILHAITTEPGPVTPALVRSIAQFWYSIALDPPVATFWKAQMQTCLDRSDADWLLSPASHAFLRVSDPASLMQLKHVWRAWLANDWSLAKLTQARNERVFTSRARPKSLSEFVTFATFGETDCEWVAEVAGLVQNGHWFDTAPLKQLAANPTMLLTRADGSCFHALHPRTLPFEGHVFDAHQPVHAEKDMLANIAKWIESLSALLKDGAASTPAMSTTTESVPTPPPSPTPATSDSTTTRPIRLQFTFNVDHPLSYMESLTISHTRFDVISTSDLADHCGLLNLLIHTSPLLKPASSPSLPHTPHVLTTTQLLRNTAETRQAYISEMLAMDMQYVPILLGVQLLEFTGRADDAGWASMVSPFTWSGAHVRDLGERTHHRFTWLACPVPSAPVQLDESPGVVQAMLRVAKEHCGSYTNKLIRPGGPMSSGALITTLIAYAMASNRLAWRVPSVSPLIYPMITSLPDPSTLQPPYYVATNFWSQVDWCTELQRTETDVGTQALLRGLLMPTGFPWVYLVEAEFPVVFDAAVAAPNLIVCVEYWGKEYHSEAIRVVDLDRKRKLMRVVFYLHGLTEGWERQKVKVSLLRPHAVGDGQREYAPMGGKVWTLDQLQVRKVSIEESPWLPVVRAIAQTTKAVIEARKAREEEGSATLIKVIDSGATLLAVVDCILCGGFDIARPTAAQVASGRGAALISINGRLHAFWMPCRVKLQSVKLARNSFTVKLVLAKQLHAFVPKAGLLGLPFHQRLHGLPALAPASMAAADLAAMSGFVFTHVEEQFRQGLLDAAQLGPARVAAFKLKQVVGAIFTHAIAGHKTVTLLRDPDDPSGDGPSAYLGLLIINGLFHHPPTDAVKDWTLALDVSVSDFAPPSAAKIKTAEAYSAAMQPVMDAVAAEHGPVVNVGGAAEAKVLGELFELAKAQCADRGVLPYPLLPGRIEHVSVVTRRRLKRAILTPLAPADDVLGETDVQQIREDCAEGSAAGGSGADDGKRSHLLGWGDLTRSDVDEVLQMFRAMHNETG